MSAGLSLSERLDRAPVCGFHWRLVIAVGLGMLFNGVCFAVLPMVLAPLTMEWSLTTIQTGNIAAVTTAGGFVGALVSGQLADLWGRKSLFIVTFVTTCLGTGLSALADSYDALLCFRFIAGFGIAGQPTVAATIVTEFSPKNARGKLVSVLQIQFAVGTVLGALLAFLVIPAWGWRAVFVVGGLPILYALHLLRALPESPRYLEARGLENAAAQIVRAIEIEAQTGPPSTPSRAPSAAPSKAPDKVGWFDIWRGGASKRTGMLLLVFFVTWYSRLGVLSWLPSLLVAAGYTVAKPLEYSMLMSLAILPAPFLSSLLLDRIGRKPLLALYNLAFIAASLGFAFMPRSPAAILLLGSLLVFSSGGSVLAALAYAPEIFPVRLRTTGTGWAVAVSQVGSALGPASVGFILASWPGRQDVVFVHLALLLSIGVASMLILAEETKGRSLD